MSRYAYNGGTLPTIPCCLCGTPITSNPASMCIDCIKSQVDITENLPNQLSLQWCRHCNRYMLPPNKWIPCELESKRLLSICLRRIKGLNKVKLIDAVFVWTEPHSRRIKVKITVQKEVFSGTILQQTHMIEYVVEGLQCTACQRYFANDSWNAVVQLRQKVEHKRTFFYIEQLILANNAHQNAINIKEVPDGLDFFFANDSAAMKLVAFLKGVSPVKWSQSKRLISADLSSNTANYKYTFPVEIASVCKDDYICMPPAICRLLAGLNSPLALCYRVTDSIHFINPETGQTAILNSENFWRNPFDPLCGTQHLMEFTVLDVDDDKTQVGKFSVCEVEVARVRDFGVNDTTFFVKTHLGGYLYPGDTVLGYDLANLVYNEANMSPAGRANLPDIVLVRKTYPNRRTKSRAWKLKRLNAEVDSGATNAKKAAQAREKVEQEFEEFQKVLEEDRELRCHIKLFKDPIGAARAQHDISTEEAVDHPEGYNEADDPLLVKSDELLEDDGIDPMARPEYGESPFEVYGSLEDPNANTEELDPSLEQNLKELGLDEKDLEEPAAPAASESN
eukprot:TRINITY_DN815_c0_g1::TRINITY_DN815_c0_g1_i2::g.25330::m.25330 TRINITY_DN815_c0_g1::TRINITY_DN815_c0_g1_i2::g.25330  ORF type:complete len:597 (+),score=131.34,sp/Q55BF2/NMD3_DICDI/49.58/4e-163,NMD3/PF04981.8/9.6e-73,NMD3/PF04981.8/4.1e+03,zf-C2H2_jaz/PF12171.3/4.5e+02,zf-C2H2_jaz/PF12171.3/2.9 TRINITY_DN815_c0_g1_i2:101-1792(+)